MRLNFIFIAAMIAAATAWAGPIYTVQVVSGLGLYANPNYATGVTDAGSSAGAVSTWTDSQAVVWSTQGASLAVVPVGLSNTQATAINASGQVAGSGLASGFSAIAFLGGSAIPGASGWGSEAYALNDVGQVAGDVYDTHDPNSKRQPAIGSTTDGMVAVPIPVNALGGIAYGINNLGQIVGVTLLSNGDEVPFFGTAAGIAVIPTVGYLPNSVSIQSINNLGQISGTGAFNGVGTAVVGNASGVTPIPLSPGAIRAFSGQQAINDAGQVVGAEYSTVWEGFIWDSILGTRKLNDLVPSGWTITNALSISQNGTILATGYNTSDPNSVNTALILTPNATVTPEPSTVFLLGGGLAGLLALHRSQRRRTVSRLA